MNNNENTAAPAIIDAGEFAVAEKEAETSGFEYTHKFRRPFSYMGKTYEELTFEWDKLTGRDGLAINAELQAIGRPSVVAAFSDEYKIRMAARACTVQIGADAFELMPLYDFNKITDRARSFLLKSER